LSEKNSAAFPLSSPSTPTHAYMYVRTHGNIRENARPNPSWTPDC
jgi:hypothetical protein